MFDRAWDTARHHAGRELEDIAFKRAIEGAEQHVFNEYRDIVCTKCVFNDRLLTFLLSNLMPERYCKEARSADRSANPAPPVESVDATLRVMETQLPAPPEAMLGPETLAGELAIADAAYGVLPHFLSEQHPPKSEVQLRAEEIAAQNARERAAAENIELRQDVSADEFRDFCHYLDPMQRHDKDCKRYRKGANLVPTSAGKPQKFLKKTPEGYPSGVRCFGSPVPVRKPARGVRRRKRGRKNPV